MGLEAVTGIADLVITNPVGATDPKSQGDDHIRNIKKALKHDFANITGAVTSSHDELNILDGATLSVAELNTLDGITSTVTELNLLDGITGTVWSSGNDGAASGLDADLLDGEQGSAFHAAANITGSHTLPDAALSTNVPLLNASNTFTGATQTISAAAAPKLAVTDTTNSVTTVVLSDDTFGFVGTSTAHTLHLATGNSSRIAIDSSGNFDFKGGTVTTNNASASEVGFKGMPSNVQASTYTLVLADAGKHLLASDNVTIPANASVAFPVGTVVSIFNNKGSALSIAITTDALTLAGTSTTGTRSVAVNGLATILKLASNSWLIFGVGVS